VSRRSRLSVEDLSTGGSVCIRIETLMQQGYLVSVAEISAGRSTITSIFWCFVWFIKYNRSLQLHPVR